MPQLAPAVFRVKLAAWQRSVKNILPLMDELLPPERQAAQWLLSAWRDFAYSQAVADRAAGEIREIEAADVAHGSNRDLRTITMGFRGIANTVYCSGGEVYAQFQQALCAQAGIPVPSRAYSPSSAEMPAAASLMLCVFSGYRIVERDVTTLDSGTSGLLRVTMVLNNLTKDKTYHFIFELVNRAGRVVKTNTVPYTAHATSGTWTPDIFQCSAIPAGEHTLRIKIGDFTLTSRTLTKKGATVSTPGPYPWPEPIDTDVEITAMSVYPSTNNGTAAGTSGSAIYTTTRYITPRITVTSAVADAHQHTFTVSIISPSGTILSDSNSPKGGTYVTRRTLSGRQTTLRLRPWGSESGRMFGIPGAWTIRVRTESGREFSHTFNVRRPSVATKPFGIHAIGFKMPDSAEFKPNLPSMPSIIQPRLILESRENGVYNIGYEIRTTDGQLVMSYAPKSQSINGIFSVLPGVRMSSPLDDREYDFILTIDGYQYPPHRFRVGEETQGGSCLTILLWVLGLPLLGGFISSLF